MFYTLLHKAGFFGRATGRRGCLTATGGVWTIGRSGVHTDYERHARQLDAAHHSHIADPAARPIFLRLTQEFPRVRGQVFGAFRETVVSAPPMCTRCFARPPRRRRRGSGARAGPHHMTRRARAAYISILRRRWGCTVALAGARLRLSRAYLAGGR